MPPSAFRIFYVLNLGSFEKRMVEVVYDADIAEHNKTFLKKYKEFYGREFEGKILSSEYFGELPPFMGF